MDTTLRVHQYDVHWVLTQAPAGSPQPWGLSGTVCIHFDEPPEPPIMLLHAASDVTIKSIRDTKTSIALTWHREPSQDLLGVTLLPDSRAVTIAFDSHVSDTAAYGVFATCKLAGVQRSPTGTPTTWGPSVLCTQFEPHGARRALPCVDMPSAKAVWVQTIDVPPACGGLGGVVLTNMPETSRVVLDSGDIRIAFAPTPPLPPYVLAFCVGEPGALYLGAQGEAENIRVRVWVQRADTAHAAHVALRAATRALTALTAITRTPLKNLPKLDCVPVFNFDSAAMENWGLMVFTPEALLVYEDGAESDVRAVVDTVTHEVAHQWFGNTVTMQDWPYLWMNEGFATLMTHYAQIGSLWTDAWARFEAEEASLGLQSLRPVMTAHPEDVFAERDVAATFDATTYQRAAWVLRTILMQLQSEEIVRQVLQTYLALGEATGGLVSPDTLWSAIRTHVHPSEASRIEAMGLQLLSSGVGVAMSASRPVMGGACRGCRQHQHIDATMPCPGDDIDLSNPTPDDYYAVIDTQGKSQVVVMAMGRHQQVLATQDYAVTHPASTVDAVRAQWALDVMRPRHLLLFFIHAPLLFLQHPDVFSALLARLGKFSSRSVLQWVTSHGKHPDLMKLLQSSGHFADWELGTST